MEPLGFDTIKAVQKTYQIEASQIFIVLAGVVGVFRFLFDPENFTFNDLLVLFGAIVAVEVIAVFLRRLETHIGQDDIN